jgi:diaminopimelate epimerase
MTIPFHKLHGARNDFLLTAAGDLPPGLDLPAIARAVCDRYTGVGADGWMLVEICAGGQFDAITRLFNSDGSEAELSGNGTRCAAAVLAEHFPEREEFAIMTGAGIKRLRVVERRGLEIEFEMNMGAPRVIDNGAQVEGRSAVIVDVGNPQCVFPVDNFEFDWRTLGAATERAARFPNRTNVSFIRRVDSHTIDVRFWERGAGETNSSGTGSTGAAAAAIARGLVESPVRVETPAGPLHLRFDNGDVFLTGPAAFVAEGLYHYQPANEPRP